jgi:hypothetical protein
VTRCAFCGHHFPDGDECDEPPIDTCERALNHNPAAAYRQSVAAHDEAQAAHREARADFAANRISAESYAAARAEWAAACEAFEAAYDRAVAAGEALRSDHADRPASPHHR